MILHQGIAFPDDVGHRWEHALMHVRSVEVGLKYCQQKRTAVQAGGNVGLWPARLAQDFECVYTFEPDAITRECLVANVPSTVIVSAAALGSTAGVSGWRHKDLGSHRIVEDVGWTIGPGSQKPLAVDVTTVDALGLDDLDFLQLDIEGYEMHALQGAVRTIERSHPVIQVELRDLSARYGFGDSYIRALLQELGYHEVAQAQGSDFIFQWRAA